MEQNSIFNNRKWSIAIALLSCLLWGSAFPVLKVSYQELGLKANDLYGKMIFAGMRFLIAGLLVLIIYYMINKEKVIIKRENIISILTLGFFNTSLLYFLFYNGLANTTGIKGAVLSSSSTFFVVLFAHFIYHNDKINKEKILGLITGFVGILLVNWTKGMDEGLTFIFTFKGEGFLVFSGIASAIGTIMAKEIGKKVHPFLMTAIQMIFGALVLLVAGIVLKGGFGLDFTNKAILLLLYASFLSATAFSLWFSLLKYNAAGEISMYKFLVPVFGSYLSFLFIQGEEITIFTLVGMFFCATGIYIVNSKKRKI